MGRLLASLVAELPAADRALLDAYAAALRRAGYRDLRMPSKVARNSSLESSGASTVGNHLWAARRFLRRWGLQGWLQLPVAEQVALLTNPGPTHIAAGIRRFVGWLALTGRQPFPPGLIDALEERAPATIRWAEQARLAWPELTARLASTARRLGYGEAMATRVCHTVARTAAHTGKAPEALTLADVLGVSAALERRQVAQRAGHDQRPPGHRRRLLWPLATGTVLYHAGLIPAPPVAAPRDTPRRAAPGARRNGAQIDFLVERWPALHAAATRYLAQRRTTVRHSTARSEAAALATFLRWLTAHHPDVTELGHLERRVHIEPYLHWVSDEAGPGARPGQEHWSPATRHHHLTCLRRFFRAVRTWEWPDAPRSTLFLPGDVPRAPAPLPKAFDDVEAARMIQVARGATDPLERLIIELLASCGLRVGEARDLTLSDIVTFGGAPGQPAPQSWLRVPLGKLGNDRYVPIGTELQAALDTYLASEHGGPRASRPEPAPSAYLLVNRGRRISEAYCNKVVHRGAARAGVANAHAHRWRHTFATQAINRGMDLATIANLLGHTRLEMTMVYARIANPKLRQEFERVSEQVQAFYAAVAQDPPGPDTPVVLPAGAVGPAMTVARREIEWRRLGNGWCTRRAYLDCRHELVCERCVHFNTDRMFLPVLEAQHADAIRKGQQARADLFAKLVGGLQAAESPGEILPVVSGPQVADFSNPNVNPAMRTP
jgi:integrase/recombinase XerD